MTAQFFSDGQIVEFILKARAGDREARERLWQDFWQVLRRFCHQEKPLRLRPKVGDSDIFQTVLLRANVAFDDFQGKSRQELEDWLLSIARNVIRDLCRHYLRQKRDVSREVPLDNLREKNEPLARDSAAEEIDEEEIRKLHDAFERLPQDCRTLIQLHDHEGLSFEEIGRRCGASGSTIGRMHRRAMRVLANELIGINWARDVWANAGNR
jgi:RNA polymerase sigma factor (sigma-70 family)